MSPGKSARSPGRKTESASETSAADANGLTENLDAPRVRPEEVEQDPERRRFARAIRTEEAEDLATPDLEVEALDGGETSVLHSQAVYRHGEFGCRPRLHHACSSLTQVCSTSTS